jgi:hypothetical protein
MPLTLVNARQAGRTSRLDTVRVPSLVRSLILAGVSLGLAPSCSSSERAGCVPGAQVSCPCAGGGVGVQVCVDAGDAYGACGSCTEMKGDASQRPDAGRIRADGGGAQDGRSNPGPDGAGVDATLRADASARMDAGPDATNRGSDAIADASSIDVDDAPTTPICGYPDATCEVPPGAVAQGGCCTNTVCRPDASPRCCVPTNLPCNIYTDCCDSTNYCDPGRHCTPRPACAKNGEGCGAGYPWITGCCSATATCDTSDIPYECCQQAGTPCQTTADCCLDLTCGDAGTCVRPSCIATSLAQSECAKFPFVPCCDPRLDCQQPTMMDPETRCCAPSGTVLGPTDSPNLCCGVGIETFADGSQECL